MSTCSSETTGCFLIFSQYPSLNKNLSCNRVRCCPRIDIPLSFLKCMLLPNSQPMTWSHAESVLILSRVQNELKSSDTKGRSWVPETVWNVYSLTSKWERMRSGGWRWGGERKFFWVQVCPCIVCMCLKDRSQPLKHFAIWDSVSQWPRFCQLVSTDWKHTPEITLFPPHQHWNYSPLHDDRLFTGVLDTKIRNPSYMAGTFLTELSFNPKLQNFETNNEFLW